MNLYVGNLNYNSTEEELTEIFEQFGIVNNVRLVIDSESKKSKGFGFVEMKDDVAAELALERLKETTYKGRNLVISIAKNAFYKKKPISSDEE